MASEKRKKLRDAIFNSPAAKFKVKEIKFLGETVEIRQPSLEMMLDAQQNESRKEAVVQLLVNYCYVPGTEEKVFEKEDRDALLSMPFNQDFVRVQEAIAELTSIEIMVEEQAKN